MIFIPILAGVAAITAIATRKKKGPVFVADEATMAKRRVIYEAALNSKDPVSLRKLAAEFQNQGCEVEARLLNQRADICDLPPEVTLARRAVFRKLMNCTDPAKVRAAAVVYEGQGCTGAAADLNRYAHGLEQAAALEAEGMTDAAHQ